MSSGGTSGERLDDVGPEAVASTREPWRLLEPQRRRGALEAVLLVLSEPVETAKLAAGLHVPDADVRAELLALAAAYERDRSGVALREVAGGWRLFASEEYAEEVERFLVEGQSARLSVAALETLAVIAYQQPVSRAHVAAVRGVGVDGVVRTLLARGLVREVGSDEVSGAQRYGTTQAFLQRLGLRSLAELPELAPLLPDSETAIALADERSIRE